MAYNDASSFDIFNIFYNNGNDCDYLKDVYLLFLNFFDDKKFIWPLFPSVSLVVTDIQTDIRMDIQTDKAAYRDARTHLKTLADASFSGQFQFCNDSNPTSPPYFFLSLHKIDINNLLNIVHTRICTVIYLENPFHGRTSFPLSFTFLVAIQWRYNLLCLSVCPSTIPPYCCPSQLAKR